MTPREPSPREKLISEPIQRAGEVIDTLVREPGGPGVPRRFLWRGREHAIAEVLEQWRETGPCRSGSREQYTRKHWFRVKTAEGLEMKLYFERQARSKREQKIRWWLYSIAASPEEKTE